LKAITKQYGQQKALNSVSLSIYQGEILALLGRNGAGKTTLIDILTGMEEPTEGSVEMGSDIFMGVCYQFEILYKELTVQQQIEFYIRVKRADMSELDRVLGEVGLLDEKSKKSKDLSGGMKRRLSVAIAIIGDP
jgi:ABC-type multidrug transport system ATPase subunit